MINFTYDEDKDIECLLTKGGGSNNSPGVMTKTYQELLEYTDDLTNREKVREFVRTFIKRNHYNLTDRVNLIQQNWAQISSEFQKRAEKIFGVSVPDIVNAYLTITGRFPLNIKQNYFFVSAKKNNVNTIVMHELWHFYTWYKFGHFEDKIGVKKYNDFKESLTILLDVECGDLMGGEIDRCYPQHKEMREQIKEIWAKSKDISEVWSALVLTANMC